MSIADELRKLDDLRQSGALTADEFARAKAAVLAGGAAPSGDAVAALKGEAALARIDREWQIERENYLVAGRHGWGRYVPTAGQGILTAVVGGGFGVLWTAIAFTMTAGFPGEGPFVLAQVFPLFGVLFVVAAVGYGYSVYTKARQYEAAYQRYQDRRAKAGGPSAA